MELKINGLYERKEGGGYWTIDRVTRIDGSVVRYSRMFENSSEQASSAEDFIRSHTPCSTKKLREVSDIFTTQAESFKAYMDNVCYMAESESASNRVILAVSTSETEEDLLKNLKQAVGEGSFVPVVEDRTIISLARVIPSIDHTSLESRKKEKPFDSQTLDSILKKVKDLTYKSEAVSQSYSKYVDSITSAKSRRRPTYPSPSEAKEIDGFIEKGEF